MNTDYFGITRAELELGGGLLVTTGDITVAVPALEAATLILAAHAVPVQPGSLVTVDRDPGAGWHASTLLHRDVAGDWVLIQYVHGEGAWVTRCPGAEFRDLLDAAVA